MLRTDAKRPSHPSTRAAAATLVQNAPMPLLRVPFLPLPTPTSVNTHASKAKQTATATCLTDARPTSQTQWITVDHVAANVRLTHSPPDRCLAFLPSASTHVTKA